MNALTRIALAAFFVSSTAVAIASTKDAPADEYFGPFQYSAISVRTKIDVLGRNYQHRWEDDASLMHDAQMAEDALKVWAKRYPHDAWLAPTTFHLAQLYAEIQTPQARSRALALFKTVATTFPKTRQGHLSRLRLQQGLPALHEELAVDPTPNPYAAAHAATTAATPAAGAATALPGLSGSPLPTGAVSPQPSTVASPASATTASPQPGNITSPQPSSASPSAAPAGAAPAASALPAAAPAASAAP